MYVCMYVQQFQYTEDVNAFQNCSLTNALLHVLLRACVCVCVYKFASVYVCVGYMFI